MRCDDERRRGDGVLHGSRAPRRAPPAGALPPRCRVSLAALAQGGLGQLPGGLGPVPAQRGGAAPRSPGRGRAGGRGGGAVDTARRRRRRRAVRVPRPRPLRGARRQADPGADVLLRHDRGEAVPARCPPESGPVSAPITADMKRVVLEQRLGFAATVCPDGTPNLSPKGTTTVWDDEHLVFAAIHSPNTVRNLRQNPAIEINVVDPIVRKGYRFKGNAS